MTAASERVALGVRFALEGVDVPALDPGVVGAADDEPTTIRRIEARELNRAWRGTDPERVRELRGPDGRLMLSVDADPELGYLLRTPADGRFWVSHDGLEVACAPLARAREAWKRLLTGQVLPLVATLRGMEVLHASGVTLAGRALLVTAPPGFGKTSVALRLVLSGASLLADDAVAIDGRGESLVCHPGTGGISLRLAEERRLAPAERARLGGTRRERGKVHCDLAPAAGPAPLAALFVLRRLGEGGDGPVLRPLPAVDPFLLLSASFNLSVRTPERLRRQLDLCARVAEDVPVSALDATPGVDSAALATAIRDWAGERVAA
jgi:hypothetical protein